MYAFCAYNLSMEYEWDPKKRLSNIEKHRIDFVDAVLVFEDEQALTIEVDEHAHKEKRFVTVGTDAEGRALTVVYTYRGKNIRIISARKASRLERGQYERLKL